MHNFINFWDFYISYSFPNPTIPVHAVLTIKLYTSCLHRYGGVVRWRLSWEYEEIKWVSYVLTLWGGFLYILLYFFRAFLFSWIFSLLLLFCDLFSATWLLHDILTVDFRPRNKKSKPHLNNIILWCNTGHLNKETSTLWYRSLRNISYLTF